MRQCAHDAVAGGICLPLLGSDGFISVIHPVTAQSEGGSDSVSVALPAVAFSPLCLLSNVLSAP